MSEAKTVSDAQATSDGKTTTRGPMPTVTLDEMAQALMSASGASLVELVSYHTQHLKICGDCWYGRQCKTVLGVSHVETETFGRLIVSEDSETGALMVTGDRVTSREILEELLAWRPYVVSGSNDEDPLGFDQMVTGGSVQ